ncbi:DUF72 domain-containing protein [Sphingomonas sp. BN140010]|uniref:DUF72 domain-containing protein n=1 Tax=Sphingomonas arvum TaxID=2992113 RepID=A0ABT3JDJ2_9SPHN|nr:DUF72 domain-containing protein [Sphingomonas sp. BN140010]MCW3797137.1 DUF72 domain-containing protein [Sphingomonas sp. BN140010]
MADLRIGTAGWSIAKDRADAFPADGSGLERYGTVFRCAEINSSFHRPHRQSTWEKWGNSVPDDFRFSVKLPKIITHERQLAGCADLLSPFLDQVALLGDKLALLLVQLPPRLAFDEAIARSFFIDLAGRTPARLTCEPRHASWFEQDADSFLADICVARVAADPARVPAAAEPGGWTGLAYWRLHGSPVTYRSSYADRIGGYAQAIGAITAPERWCIFDNTASSAATGDALALCAAMRPRTP